jgi:amino acid adenylation domain-containing protein
MMEQASVVGYRLSPQQRRVWLAQHDASGMGLAYDAQCRVVIEGALNVEDFKAAVRDVVSRHEILRTRFVGRAGMKTPVQVIEERSDADWRVEDLSDLDPERQASRVEELSEEETRCGPADERESTLRVVVLKLSGRRYVMILTLPSLCADSRSLINLAHEICRRGSARRADELPDEEPVQYVQFSEWQNELLEGEEAEEGRRFWGEHLSDVPSAPPLPFKAQAAPVASPTTDDTARGGANKAAEAPAHATQPINFGGEVTRQLIDLAGRSGHSLAVMLQGCWEALLWRLTGEPVLPVGRLLDGRRYEELAGALGLFARRVPLASRVTGRLRFGELCAQVAERNQAAEEWQEYWTGEREGPLVGFEFDEREDVAEAGGVSWVMERLRSGSERLALNLRVVRRGATLEAELEYDARVYGEAEAERLAGYYERAVRCAATEEGLALRVCELEVLGEAERRLLIEGMNETGQEYEVRGGVHELFEEVARAHGGRVAVEYEGEALTYAELNTRANRLAHHLRGLGVGPETLVGICVERSLEMIVALLGVLKAGGAYVPLDVAYATERLSLMLEDARVTVLLTQSKLTESLSGYGARVVCLDSDSARSELARRSGENLGPQSTTANLAYVLFTSGSSGRPKGVAVEHGQLLNYVNGILEKLSLASYASFATVSTFAADLGNTAIFPSLCAGGRLHVISRERATNPDALAEYFARHEIDCLKIVPSHLEALLSAAEPEKVLPRQRLVLGGEASRPAWVETLRSLAPGCRVMNHYGPTEATVGVLTYEVAGDDPGLSSPTMPLGRPLANTRIYILDSQLSPVPLGVPGELYIGGESVTRGYYRRPDATAENFLPDPFGEQPGARMYKTGDLARYLPDANVEFLGRNDDQVKIHGYRIEPGEIEWALSQHASVREAVVVAREDALAERRLVAYLVCRQHQSPSASELQDFLREKLPEYMIPPAFVVLESMPLSANGKIDRRALPDPDGSALRDESSYVAPRTTLEEVLAAMWAEVLKLERVGVRDNFFALGGHSLTAMQIMSRLRKTFQMELPLRVVFEATTVEKLARGIVEHEAKPGQAEKIATIVKKIQGMSDEEKRAMLKERRPVGAA